MLFNPLREWTIRLAGSRPISALLSTLLNGRGSIFVLHRFSAPSLGLDGLDPALLRSYLERLRRRRTPILALRDAVTRTLAGAPLPNGAVIFTMDDGFWDQGEIGAELFLEFDIPLTIFLITGLQDGQLWPWDDRLGHVFRHTRRTTLDFELPSGRVRCSLEGHEQRQDAKRATRELFKRIPFEELEPLLAELALAAEVEIPAQPPAAYRPIGWEAARKLESRGIRFGPHTLSHGIVSQMSDSTARHELLGAWSRLETELSDPEPIYGWPTGRRGDFTSRDIAIVREAGFLGAVSTIEDYARFHRDEGTDALFRLPRFGLPGSLPDFIQCSTGIERVKQLTRSRLVRSRR